MISAHNDPVCLEAFTFSFSVLQNLLSNRNDPGNKIVSQLKAEHLQMYVLRSFDIFAPVTLTLTV